MQKALVVDDTKGIRNLLTECLELYGYEVFPACSGQEAINILQNEHIDIAFIDIRMPEISGTELLRKIREIGLKMPVVIMTAFATIKNAVECTKLGANAYLQKPFTADKVKSVLNEIYKVNSNIIDVELDPLKVSLDLINNNNIPKALEKLKDYLFEDFTNYKVYYQFGLIYQHEGDVDMSEKFFRISEILKEK